MVNALEVAVAVGLNLRRGRKVITALFPYAILRGKEGQGRMLDAFFRIAGAAEEHTPRQPSAGSAPREC